MSKQIKSKQIILDQNNSEHIRFEIRSVQATSDPSVLNQIGADQIKKHIKSEIIRSDRADQIRAHETPEHIH